MVGLIPVFWVLLVFGPIEVIDDTLEGRQFRNLSPSSSVTVIYFAQSPQLLRKQEGSNGRALRSEHKNTASWIS